MENLSIQLHKEALDLGLCAQWSGEWKNEDGQQELIDRYKRGFDFALKHNWPSPEFIDANFSKSLLNKNCIWNNERIEWNDDSKNGRHIVNGSCTGKLKFGWFSVVTLYVRHNSNISIDCSGESIVQICVYDNASVNVTTSENARASVILHGKSCSYNIDDGVIVRGK